MHNDEIDAHAEARANMTNAHPTEFDFRVAREEIVGMLSSGASYSLEFGWTFP